MTSNAPQLIGAAYVQKLNQARRLQTAFTDYDALTPDEPIWTGQFVKSLLLPLCTTLAAVLHLMTR